MTQPEAPLNRHLFGRQRWIAAVLGVGFLCPLVIALFLQPSERGYGTHQQLGLPPCSFEMLFGRPCPSCGSTTAFACVVRGCWRDALRANAGGALLAVLCVLVGPWLLASAASGRWLLWVPSGPRVALIMAGIATIMVIGWVVRLCGG